MPASWAMAVRCNTVFDEPPMPMSVVIAFSNASRVMMSRGQIFFLTRSMTTAPARFASRRRAPVWAAGLVPLPGSPMPRASVREFIVFAVKSPAQEPQLGQAWASRSAISSALILPAANLPAASKHWLTLTSCPWKRPASIAPPLTTTDGILSRAAAISMPGTTLSQFGIRTRPSKPLAVATASMESAISSRLASENFMPVWPMAMPSQTPMAGNSIGVPPAAATPSFAASVISRRCMCPGMTSLNELQMPINGFSSSSGPKPRA